VAVDEPRKHEPTVCVDRLICLEGRERRIDLDNPIAIDGDVAFAHQFHLLGIEQRAV